MGKSLKREFVVDTSALISLETAKLLKNTLKIARITITPLVASELETFAKFQDTYGKTSREILKCKSNFRIAKVDVKETLSFIEETDNELYNVAKQKSLTLITDDIKLLRHLKGKADAQFSTFFLAALLGAGQLTEEKAIELLEKMRKARNWKNNLIYLTAKKELEIR